MNPVWQSIETAPKNGTDVLVYCPHDMRRDSQAPDDLTSPIVVAAYRGREYDDNGWWVSDIVETEIGYYGDVYVNPERLKPTHWMPLPEPPK